MFAMRNNYEMGGRSSVVNSGYFKKLKTFKKKFFVLRAETVDSSARLEYYDNERKYHNAQPPKRVIPLKNCFNINRRLDVKNKIVVGLFTKDDNFGIVFENDQDADTWLRFMLALQRGEEIIDGVPPPKPYYEHVWHVNVLNRGLGRLGLTGCYHLCLTDKTLSLIKTDCKSPHIRLNLPNIRSCGSLKDFFFLEIGRQSSVGAGELWMQTEDFNIADNIHATVFHAMSNSREGKDKEDLGPTTRNRSSSATEASRPQTLGRKQTLSTGAQPKSIFPPGIAGGRERCDSMPSRARTTSEGTSNSLWIQTKSHLVPHRPSSLYNREISHSPPTGSPVSPPSAGCSTDSTGSSYSLVDEAEVYEPDTALGRYGHSLTPDEAIAEEDCPDSPSNIYGASPNYVPMNMHGSDDGYVDMSPRGRHHNNSPTTSLSSVTSGTPSTDMRFAEYHLQKVSSYFSNADETDDERPARAYSVGSRPNKNEGIEIHPTESDKPTIRTRALSVGSKVKKPPSRVLPPHGYHCHTGNKSSSAPLLSQTRSQGSHNSIGPMDHLMEMDFSGSGSINSTEYMDMTPSKTTNYGYVEMKPTILENPQPEQSYMDMTCGSSSPARSFNNSVSEHSLNEANSHDYVNMDGGKTVNNNNDYLDMSFKKSDVSYQVSPVRSSFMPSNGISDDKKTDEGYVEMTLGKGGHHRQASLDSAQIQDYTNMSFGNKTKKREKTKSQPITIQTPRNQKTSSGSPLFSISRKHSTGTSPLHLNLANPFGSLPRQLSRKDNRKDSKDSSSSSVTTPSSSSTIFPMSLNSPSSPVKPNLKIPATILNITYKKKDDKTDDYLPMDFGKNNTQSDYMNFNPESAFRPIDDETTYEVLRTNPESGRSRPSSASSEVCSSSGSTVVGSRPESVNSDRVRPASVSSADVQLHYASLDLDDGNRSPRAVKSGSVSSEGQEPNLTYASIDYIKSGGFKHNSFSKINANLLRD